MKKKLLQKKWISALLSAFLILIYVLAGPNTESDQSDPVQTQTEETTSIQPEEQTTAQTLPEESKTLEQTEASPPVSEIQLPEDGIYTTKEDVALYIHLYEKLPSNFITKKEAQKLGWPGGDLEPYAPGKCIGGDRFGNYEELLPVQNGRTYTECDIDTLGAEKRGSKRIVFSNDGLIYYTEDHYESFELLYGEE